MSRTTPSRASRWEGDLDPVDWEEFRRDCHRALDDMIDHLATVRERPVWQAAPCRGTRAASASRCRARHAHCARCSTISPPGSSLTPPATGIRCSWAGCTARARRSGWLPKCWRRGSTPIAAAATTSARCRAPDRRLGGADCSVFRPTRRGVFVTGTSVANFVALLVARDAALGDRRSALRAA